MIKTLKDLWHYNLEWWPGAESNCRHADFQSAALPTELPGHIEPHDKNREEAEL